MMQREPERFHDLGLKVLTVSADMDSLREGKYEDIIKRAKQLKTDRATFGHAPLTVHSGIKNLYMTRL